MTLENCLTNVSSVWQWVPDVAGYFNEIKQRLMQGKTGKYTPADITAAI